MPTISGLMPSPAMAGSDATRVTAAANNATNSTPFSWPRVDGAEWCGSAVVDGVVDMTGLGAGVDGMALILIRVYRYEKL